MMNDNLKIAVNSVIIFIRLCVMTFVGLFMSRVVLDALGASDYGLYNVVGGIVTLLYIVNTAMLSTTYRYIAFEVGKKENGNPQKVFSASFYIHGCFSIIILLLGLIVGDWYIHNYLNIDQTKISDALFVYHISLLTTAVSTLLIPYQGLIVAFEKFTVNAIIDVTCNIIKFVIILLFIYSASNKLRTYSIILMLTTFFSSIIYLLYSYKNFYKIVKLKFLSDFKLYKEMLSYAFWTLFGAVAIIGKDQGGKLLINYFFGTLVNAAYAVATQLEALIVTFARSLSHAAVPQITKNFSGGNKNRSITLTSYISKYTYILMLFIAFPALLNMDWLLSLWLVDVPSGASLFCKLIILNALLSCLGEGIPALVNATGNIKVYQIIYQTFNFLGLPIAFVFFKIGFGQYSISIIYCLITFLCVFVRIYLLKRIFDFDVISLVKISYYRVLIISIPLILYYYFYNDSGISMIQHLLGILGAEIFLILIIVLLGLDRREWEMVKRTVNRAKHRN